MKNTGGFRRRFWLRALIVGLALAGEFHFLSVEVLHHHQAAQAICRLARERALTVEVGFHF